MSLLLTGGTVFWKGHFQNMDLAMDQGRIVSVPQEAPSVISLPNCLIVPGFVDVHVHLREPGFSYKETISTGTAAAAAGGYTAVCAMPNLSPVPDSLEHLRVQQELIARHAKVRVYPYGSITQGEQGSELADLAALAPYVAGFSDDGRGVQSEPLMRRAMELAKKLERPIVAHSEDESLLSPGWAVHDGDFARRHGLIGNNPESEWRQVERDLRLVRETGCRYHVCHVSTKESVALIRAAKAEGLPVSCETGPHYLVLCDALLSAAVEKGISRILVNHPFCMINATLEQMSRWASIGAILELNACDIDPVSSFADGDPGVVGAMLETIPAERLVIDSDYGQNGNIEPVEGLIHFAQFLRDKFGVSEEQIHQMGVVTPGWLLGLHD